MSAATIVHLIAGAGIILFGLGSLCLANHFWWENEKLRRENARLKERLSAPRPMPLVTYLGEFEEAKKHGQDTGTASR